MLEDAAQRMLILSAILPTKSQDLTISFPLKGNLNLSALSESAQVEHVPQVTGHASETPVRPQRLVVSLFATQVQYLEMVSDEPITGIFSLSPESTHFIVGDAVGEAVTGVPVGLDVGCVGVADGLGEGLIDVVGEEVGLSLGTSLGSKLGMSLGDADGASEGVSLGSKLGMSLGTSLGMSEGDSLGMRLGASLGTSLGMPEGDSLGT